MLSRFLVAAAMATFVPSLHASTLRADFLFRRSQDAVHAVINDHSVFQAFSEAGHPDTVPVEEWRNDSGEVFQSHYQFDTDEWNAMRFELAKRAGIDEAVLATTNLTTRQISEDPPDFFCTNFNKNPKVSESDHLSELMTEKASAGVLNHSGTGPGRSLSVFGRWRRPSWQDTNSTTQCSGREQQGRCRDLSVHVVQFEMGYGVCLHRSRQHRTE